MTIQIISLIIALLAVIAGPIVTYIITKQNLEFQFDIRIKETWLNKLEESSHSFLFSTLEWIEKYRGLADGSAKHNEPNREIDRMFDSINSSFIKLQLQLDEVKPVNELIMKNVIEMKDIVNKKAFDENTINKLRSCYDEITQSLKKAFHEERTKTAGLFR